VKISRGPIQAVFKNFIILMTVKRVYKSAKTC